MSHVIVSIITAAHPERTAFLESTAHSIAHLKKTATPDTTIEWVLSWDGPSSTLPAGVVPDTVVALSSHSGVACTRNNALAAASGEVVTTVDADDELVAEGFWAGLDFLASNTHCGWVGLGRTLMDNQRTKHSPTTQHTWRAGELATQWTAPFPFHPNSMMVKAASLWEVGGWPALSCNEDLALALLLSESSDGGYLPEILTRYRTWEGQMVASSAYPRDKKQSFRFIERAINQVRASRQRQPIHAPAAPGGAHGIEARTGAN